MGEKDLTEEVAVSKRQAHLLIVETDDTSIQLLNELFTNDYCLHIVPDTKTASQVISTYPVGVVIYDHNVLGKHERRFIKTIQQSHPDIVCLLLTAGRNIDEMIEAINEGHIYRYIQKPWNNMEFQSIVREALDRYDLQVQNRELLQELQITNVQLEARVLERTSQLEEANKQLLQLNKQKDTFLGMAAHDLRTPITIMQGFADLMVHPRTPAEDVREFGHIIRETLDDMRRLINNLLDYTTIATGRLQLDIETVDMNNYIVRIMRYNRMLANMKNIKLNVNIDQMPETFMFDPHRIEQVLNNLLSNAIKFSHPETQVTLYVLLEDIGLKFIVEDQGLGIRDDELDKVFGAFQKLSASPTGDESSTGLGLSICKRIVELHGGEIQVCSVLGEGSQFSFYLPVVGIPAETV